MRRPKCPKCGSLYVIKFVDMSTRICCACSYEGLGYKFFMYKSTPREVYEECFKYAYNFVPDEFSEDTKNRRANLYAVKNTPYYWRLQWKN